MVVRMERMMEEIARTFLRNESLTQKLIKKFMTAIKAETAGAIRSPNVDVS